jgi:hypothetical protein
MPVCTANKLFVPPPQRSDESTDSTRETATQSGDEKLYFWAPLSRFPFPCPREMRTLRVRGVGTPSDREEEAQAEKEATYRKIDDGDGGWPEQALPAIAIVSFPTPS